MTQTLSPQQQLKFSTIMFQSQGRQHQQIQNLSPEQRSKLKSLYAQKIAYDTVNANMPQQVPHQSKAAGTSEPAGIVGTVCCCFMPEQNRDNFDITSSTFLKRIFNAILFFKGGFFNIDQGRSQLYGYLWLSLTYVIILGIAANLNEYFILPTNYKFDTQIMIKALGISAIFLISEPFIYAAVAKCLGGYVSTVESMMLCGYSTIHYFIPTLLCLIPSLYWHVMMLAIGSFLRTIFLFRNYSQKIPSKSIALLPVIAIIEAFFVFVLLRVLFTNDNGYNFSDGTSRVFKHQVLRSFVI